VKLEFYSATKASFAVAKNFGGLIAGRAPGPGATCNHLQPSPITFFRRSKKRPGEQAKFYGRLFPTIKLLANYA